MRREFLMIILAFAPLWCNASATLVLPEAQRAAEVPAAVGASLPADSLWKVMTAQERAEYWLTCEPPEREHLWRQLTMNERLALKPLLPAEEQSRLRNRFRTRSVSVLPEGDRHLDEKSRALMRKQIVEFSIEYVGNCRPGAGHSEKSAGAVRPVPAARSRGTTGS